VTGDPIWVETGADDSALDMARKKLETALDAVTDRAHAIVDRKRG
jgi:hypothetical protein